MHHPRGHLIAHGQLVQRPRSPRGSGGLLGPAVSIGETVLDRLELADRPAELGDLRGLRRGAHAQPAMPAASRRTKKKKKGAVAARLVTLGAARPRPGRTRPGAPAHGRRGPWPEGGSGPGCHRPGGGAARSADVPHHGPALRRAQPRPGSGTARTQHQDRQAANADRPRLEVSRIGRRGRRCRSASPAPSGHGTGPRPVRQPASSFMDVSRRWAALISTVSPAPHWPSTVHGQHLWAETRPDQGVAQLLQDKRPARRGRSPARRTLRRLQSSRPGIGRRAPGISAEPMLPRPDALPLDTESHVHLAVRPGPRRNAG